MLSTFHCKGTATHTATEAKLHLNRGRDFVTSPPCKALQKVIMFYKQHLFLINSSFSSLIKFMACIY